MNVAGKQQFEPRQRAISLLAVISTTFGVGLSFGMGYPLTAVTFESWKEPKWLIGVAGSAPALAVLLVLPFIPRLAARIGPVMAMTIGCVIGATGFLALYYTREPIIWIAIRFLMSFGLAIPWLISETWINSVSTEETRSRVIAGYAIAFFLGFSVGPFILQSTGSFGLWSFAVGALGVLSALIPLSMARRFAPEIHHARNQKLRSVIGLAPIAIVGGYISGVAEITCVALIPNVAMSAGLPQSRALFMLSLMTAGGMFLQFPIGWLADKVSRSGLMLAAIAAFIAMTLLLPILIVVPFASAVAAVSFGGAVWAFYTLSLSIVGERVPPSNLATANAAFLIMYQIGAITGPLITGIAMTFSPVNGFVGGMVIIMSISGLAVAKLDRG